MEPFPNGFYPITLIRLRKSSLELGRASPSHLTLSLCSDRTGISSQFQPLDAFRKSQTQPLYPQTLEDTNHALSTKFFHLTLPVSWSPQSSSPQLEESKGHPLPSLNEYHVPLLSGRLHKRPFC